MKVLGVNFFLKHSVVIIIIISSSSSSSSSSSTLLSGIGGQNGRLVAAVGESGSGCVVDCWWRRRPLNTGGRKSSIRDSTVIIQNTPALFWVSLFTTYSDISSDNINTKLYDKNIKKLT